jgi:hypothetical protein
MQVGVRKSSWSEARFPSDVKGSRVPTIWRIYVNRDFGLEVDILFHFFMNILPEKTSAQRSPTRARDKELLNHCVKMDI